MRTPFQTSVSGRVLARRWSSVLGLAVVLAFAAVLGSAEQSDRPVWISQPKSDDSIYMYVVGHASDQASALEAREAAMRNARRLLADRLSMRGPEEVDPDQVQKVELVPGCYYRESSESGWSAWVQVSCPLRQPDRRGQLDRRRFLPPAAPPKETQPGESTHASTPPSAPESGSVPGTGLDYTKPDTATGSITPEGGTVSLKDGTRLIFPSGAVAETMTVTLSRHDPTRLREGDQHRCVLLECKAGTPVFKKDVELRVPLGPEDCAGDMTRFRGGEWDPATGTMQMMTVTVDQGTAGSELVMRVQHFTWFVFDWFTTHAPVPAVVEPLEIPIYKQGKTEFCWATTLHSITRATGAKPGTTVYGIIGQVGMPYLSAVDLAGNTALQTLVEARLSGTGTATNRTYLRRQCWRPVVSTAASAKRFIRERLAAGVPVMICPAQANHAFVLVGYDDRGNWFVNDPRDPPGYLKTRSQMGYYRLDDEALNLASIGRGCTTLYIWRKLDSARSLVSVNLLSKDLSLDQIRKNADGDETRKYLSRFVWTHTDPRGYEWRGVSTPDEGGTVHIGLGDAMAVDATKVGNVDVINASRTTPAEVTVRVRVLGPGRTELFSKDQQVTVPPTSRRFVPLSVDTSKFPTQAGSAVDRKPYRLVVSLLQGGTLHDEASADFVLSEASACWQYVETRFHKTDADKPTVITASDPSSITLKTEYTPSFTAEGGEGRLNSEFRLVTKEYRKEGEVRTDTRHCAGELEWELNPAATTLTPGQKVRITIKARNTSESDEVIVGQAVFTKADVPITHTYEAEVPIAGRNEGEGTVQKGEEKTIQGEGVVPEPGKILFDPETEEMVIRVGLHQSGRAVVDRVYRWAKGTVAVTNLPARQ